MYGSPNSDPNSSIRLCVYKLHQTLRTRSTLYTRCTMPRPLMDVNQAMPNNLLRKAFCTTNLQISTGPRSWTRTAHKVYVYTTCTKLGGPVGPCIPGVGIPDRSRMLTRPWQTIYKERHFRAPPARICTAPKSRTRTTQLGCVCVYKVHQTWRDRSALYTKCTTPRPLTDVYEAVENNLQ